MHANNSFYPDQGTARAPSAPRSRWASTRRKLAFVAGGIAALLLTVASTGAAYEMIAGQSDQMGNPPVGTLVDIGGYRLHITCIGQGSPTVILDAGLGGSSLDWMLVQPELAKMTRVCAYDRPGMGWSDPGPAPRSQGKIAEELHQLLQNAAIPGPYVLVAHSLSGKTARLFAAAHPDEVAGMVLVDARGETIDARMSPAETDAFNAMLKTQARMYSVARHLGLARLFGASLVDKPLLPPQARTEMTLLQTQPSALTAMMQEGLARSANDDTLAHLTLGQLPLVVIAAGESLAGIPQWAEAQNALVESSSKGQLVIAEGSSHYIQLDDPAPVIKSVAEVMASH
jgi:pimeloyl-ACP methyl ester carboxylesterase